MATQPNQRPVLDLLASMTAESLDAASNLDPETLMLVRIAALVAVDASAGSYVMNLGVAADTGVQAEQIQSVLAAVAPIVGAPRVVSAAGRMADALGVAIDMSQSEAR